LLTIFVVTGAQAQQGAGQNVGDIKYAFKLALRRKLREIIASTGVRSDGRGAEDVRPISIETDFLPGAHGSALFTRGETQALCTATVGTHIFGEHDVCQSYQCSLCMVCCKPILCAGSKAMEARYETVEELGSKRFYLQYRFPPSSVGEVRNVYISPSR
jgi:polyribonucleotide nucleotidyltransferase